jgi:hypothetical protein
MQNSSKAQSRNSEARVAHYGVHIQDQNRGALENEEIGAKDGEFESY